MTHPNGDTPQTQAGAMTASELFQRLVRPDDVQDQYMVRLMNASNHTNERVDALLDRLEHVEARLQHLETERAERKAATDAHLSYIENHRDALLRHGTSIGLLRGTLEGSAAEPVGLKERVANLETARSEFYSRADLDVMGATDEDARRFGRPCVMPDSLSHKTGCPQMDERRAVTLHHGEGIRFRIVPSPGVGEATMEAVLDAIWSVLLSPVVISADLAASADPAPRNGDGS